MQEGQLLDYRGYKIFFSKAREYHACIEDKSGLKVFDGSARKTLSESKMFIDELIDEKLDEMVENEINSIILDRVESSAV